ncbi:MAG: hypothetical protein JNN07_20410 [Verrucomicrobiales bacterium]|nr:hypothetical protein [Verrucomicrobiales bacterium]
MLKRIILSLIGLYLGNAAHLQAAERFRTDINPALLYWQAWAQIPDFSEADRGYLFTNEWRGQVLPPRAGELLSRYNSVFKLLYRGGKAQVPCVWGYDLTDGPEALLPGLAKAKAVAQAARLRVSWHLQQGNQAAARDELIAAFIEGRNLATDRILISALVQFAIENICMNAVVDNYHRFKPETLKEVMAGFAAAPARGSIADSISTERSSMYGWILVKLADLKAEAKNEPEMLEKAQALLQMIVSTPDQPRPEWAKDVLAAAGGSMDGLMNYVKQLDPLYTELESILRLPYSQASVQIKQFNQKIENQPNLLAREFLGPFDRSLAKQFEAEVKLSMLRAAVAYTTQGETGLNSVIDPSTRLPFEFQPFSLNGARRGFQLRAQFGFGDAPGVLIFAEKDGPAFYPYGKDAGKPLK